MSVKKSKKTSGKNTVKWVIIALEIVVLLAALLIWWALDYSEGLETPEETTQAPTGTTAPTGTEVIPQVTVPEPVLEDVRDTEAYLGDGLKIINVASYTGAFVEDGSNEIVSGVLMLVVTNTGDDAIQYAEITLPTDAGDAKFTLSTLPVGESVVLLEQNRMAYTGNEDAAKAVSDNVAFFSEPLELCQEQLKLQILNGAINVTNISGEDISGDIVIYYKNAAADLYYGGITYRIRIEGGIRAGEIKQLMASHFDQAGSKVMFITLG